jgi:hypothetical protein
MIVYRAFFIFSSSPVERMNLIPHQVIAMTARIPVIRIKYWIIAAIAISGVLLIVGRSSLAGGVTVIAAKAHIVEYDRKKMKSAIFCIRF